MALIMYLTKVHRYQNLTTNTYETIPLDDLVLIDKYFTWKMVKANGGNSGNSLEEWCGIPETKLSHKYVVNYYHDFFTLKQFYQEYIGETEGYSVFSQLARIVKANQTFRWFIENVMGGKPDNKYHEVSKEQFADLLYACRRVRKGFTLIDHDENLGDRYSVNEDVAKQYLPLMDEKGFFFGTDSYGVAYARTTIQTLHAVKHILDTTDFDKETIYFNATW